MKKRLLLTSLSMLALLPLASCSEEANPNEGDDLKAFIQDQENKYEITFKA